MTANPRLSEDVKAKMMSEEDLLKCVVDMAHLYGWRVAHFRPAQLKDKNGKARWVTAVQGDGKGFPDLVMVNPAHSRLIFVELKSQKGKLSPEQIDWLDCLDFIANEHYVWRPSDWLSGEIEKVLSQ